MKIWNIIYNYLAINAVVAAGSGKRGNCDNANILNRETYPKITDEYGNQLLRNIADQSKNIFVIDNQNLDFLISNFSNFNRYLSDAVEHKSHSVAQYFFGYVSDYNAYLDKINTILGSVDEQNKLIDLVNKNGEASIKFENKKIINADNSVILDLEKAKTFYVDDGSKTKDLEQTISNVFGSLTPFNIKINFKDYEEDYKFKEDDIIFINISSNDFAMQVDGEGNFGGYGSGIAPQMFLTGKDGKIYDLVLAHELLHSLIGMEHGTCYESEDVTFLYTSLYAVSASISKLDGDFSENGKNMIKFTSELKKLFLLADNKISNLKGNDKTIDIEKYANALELYGIFDLSLMKKDGEFYVHNYNDENFLKFVDLIERYYKKAFFTFLYLQKDGACDIEFCSKEQNSMFSEIKSIFESSNDIGTLIFKMNECLEKYTYNDKYDDRLISEFYHLESKLSQLNIKYKDLESHRNAIRDHNNFLAGVISDLTQKLKDKNHELETINIKQQNLINEIATLKSNYNKALAENVDSTQKLKDKNDELEAINIEKQNLTNEISTLKSNYNKALAENVDSTQKLKDKNDELKTINEELEAINIEKQNMTNEIATLKSDNTNLKKVNSESESKLKKDNSVIAEMQEKNKEMEEKYKETQEKNKEMEEKNKETEEKYKETQEKNKEIEEKYKEMEEKYKESHDKKENSDKWVKGLATLSSVMGAALIVMGSVLVYQKCKSKQNLDSKTNKTEDGNNRIEIDTPENVEIEMTNLDSKTNKTEDVNKSVEIDTPKNKANHNVNNNGIKIEVYIDLESYSAGQDSKQNSERGRNK